jgi:PAS domain S-box-containing protein
MGQASVSILVPLVNVRGTELLASDSREVYRQKIARITLDAMVQFVGLLDPTGTVLEINQAALDAVGGKLPDVEGKPFWTTSWWQVSLEIRDVLKQSIQRAAQGEFVRWDSEIYGRAGGKETIVIDASLQPVKDEQGQVVFLVAEGRDINGKAEGRHTTEERRQAIQSSALLSAIVDSSDDAIISKDLNSVIMSWNKSAERLFGYSAAEAIGRSVVMLIPPERLGEEPRILDRLRSGERVDHFETVRVRKDGSHLNVSLTISPVKDAEGHIVGASKIARDITERVRNDAALQATNAALRQANADLQQFAWSASHDLQEPLRMVTVYSELLRRRFSGQLGPQGEEYIGYAIQGATRMENLLRDLRTYLEISTGEPPPAAEIDSDEVLRKALSNLTQSIKESGTEVVSAALPRVRMLPVQLEQLLQNLIGNAIRYRRDVPPRIRIAAGRRDDEWLFSVQDNGLGIEPRYQQQIFGMFKRLHGHTQHAGTGMGLAICQRIVERAGGKIWVESEPGCGSTFYFTIPCAEPS